ncbi:MAG: biotin/lipoyl-binding protein [Proteobacteria bacterium]|nr:biotin/lipoyl-binding protein [Pseudomonadota bacterium]
MRNSGYRWPGPKVTINLAPADVKKDSAAFDLPIALAVCAAGGLFASDKLDEVLKEIPAVRKDLGYVPLVTPTSQIVGTQSVINVLSGERYKSISKETAGVLKGEYGATAAEVNKELQQRVLDGADPITCRPADLIEPEMERLTSELKALAKEEGIQLAENEIDDVLIYALFHQVGIKFLKNRNNPDAFEPAPGSEPDPVAVPAKAASPAPAAEAESYRVIVNGTEYDVVVATGSGDISLIATAPPPTPGGTITSINAPMTGNVIEVLVSVGQQVKEGDPVIIIEAMKMETEIRSSCSGAVQSIEISKGDAIRAEQVLMTIA